jgi:hypothetical protein
MRETYGAREDITGQRVWVVCKMGVSEGCMTRQAVALELVCVAQGHVVVLTAPRERNVPQKSASISEPLNSAFLSST